MPFTLKVKLIGKFNYISGKIKGYLPNNRKSVLLSIFGLLISMVVIVTGVILTARPKVIEKSKAAQGTKKVTTKTSMPAYALNSPKQVYAFYYGWFCPPQFGCWDTSRADQPALGRYESNDLNVIKSHVRDAKASGIDGFIISWVGYHTDKIDGSGNYDPNNPNNKTNEVLKKLLEVAEEEGNFKIAIDFEPGIISKMIASPRTNMKYHLDKVLSLYGSHPNFLKYDGKPVVFIWQNELLTSTEWKEIINYSASTKEAYYVAELGPSRQGETGVKNKLFDNVHQYSAWWTGSMDSQVKMWANTGNILPRFGTVAPGFFGNSATKPYGRWADGKEDTYVNEWNYMLSQSPEVILITSFNEWPEGTYLENGSKWGTRYLELTKEYITKFKSGAPTPTATPTSTLTPVPTAIPILTPKPTISPTAQPSLTPVPTQTANWVGKYYNWVYNKNEEQVKSYVLTRNDSSINFDWGSGNPASGVNSDRFYVSWSKSDYFASGKYRFNIEVDDGIKVTIDNIIYLDVWWDQEKKTNYQFDATLSSRNHDIVVEYYNNVGPASVKVNYLRL
jgi:hypothetical protein